VDPEKWFEPTHAGLASGRSTLSQPEIHVYLVGGVEKNMICLGWVVDERILLIITYCNSQRVTALTLVNVKAGYLGYKCIQHEAK